MLAAFRFCLVIALPFNDPVPGLHLGDIQAGHFQARALKHIRLDFSIVGPGFCSGHIQLGQVQVHVDMLDSFEFGQ